MLTQHAISDGKYVSVSPIIIWQLVTSDYGIIERVGDSMRSHVLLTWATTIPSHMRFMVRSPHLFINYQKAHPIKWPKYYYKCTWLTMIIHFIQMVKAQLMKGFVVVGSTIVLGIPI